MTIICPYCLSELSERAAACPQCGGRFEGRNPVGTLSVGTVLGGRYTCLLYTSDAADDGCSV